MLDPLGQSQVIPYLRELSTHGLRFIILSFERLAARGQAKNARCENLRRHLAQYNIEWHWLRYHQRPSLPATFYDVVAGMQLGQRLVGRYRVEMVHARCGIPAAIALTLKRRFKLKMICDVRGLIAEEDAEAGYWREGNIPYRLMKRQARSSRVGCA